MGNYTIFLGGGGFEHPRRGRQARNLTTTVPKILDLRSSSEQIFSKHCRRVPLTDVPADSADNVKITVCSQGDLIMSRC